MSNWFLIITCGLASVKQYTQLLKSSSSITRRTELNLENKDTSIIRTLLFGPKVSGIDRFHALYYPKFAIKLIGVSPRLMVNVLPCVETLYLFSVMGCVCHPNIPEN